MHKIYLQFMFIHKDYVFSDWKNTEGFSLYFHVYICYIFVQTISHVIFISHYSASCCDVCCYKTSIEKLFPVINDAQIQDSVCKVVNEAQVSLVILRDL